MINPNNISRSLVLIFMLGLSSGCSSLPTVKEAANQLEKIKLGTSSEEINNLEWKQEVFLNQVNKVPHYINAMLLVNPSMTSTLKLYRQWPEGILLNLVESDLFIPLRLRDSSYTSGSVDVFFTKNMEYKGFLAYSYTDYSKDTQERFNIEKSLFAQCGLSEESSIAEKRLILEQKGGTLREKAQPILPLSKNRTANKEKIESLMKEIQDNQININP